MSAEVTETTAAHGATSPEDRAIEQRRRKAAMLSKTREHRTLDVGGLELRADGEGGTLTLSGYACLVGVQYDVGYWKEEVAPGAFRRTLGEQPDVQLLVNHGGLPLARTRSGTLRLSEDTRGLAVEADLDPEDRDVQSLQRKMARGDIDQMSFAFQVLEDAWDEDYSSRTIRSLSIHRGDVSVVNQGASPTTFATIRSRAADALAAYEPAMVVAALVEWRDWTLLSPEERAGKTLSAATVEILTNVLNLVATADDAVDQAQPLLAELMGVPNPDDDDEPAEDAPDEPETQDRAAPLPDYTTTARQRLALARTGGPR